MILLFTMILLTYFRENPMLLFLLSNSYLANFTKKLSIVKKNVFCHVAITAGMEVAQNYWLYG